MAAIMEHVQCDIWIPVVVKSVLVELKHGDGFGT